MELSKCLILSMLCIDDEPLNLILNEAIIDNDNKHAFKDMYRQRAISKEEIRAGLDELLKEGSIILLDCKGSEIKTECSKIISESDSRWMYWFRITRKGRDYLNNLEKVYYEEN